MISFVHILILSETGSNGVKNWQGFDRQQPERLISAIQLDKCSLCRSVLLKAWLLGKPLIQQTLLTVNSY